MSEDDDLDDQITLDNWQLPPYNRRAFRRIREFLPTQLISRGEGSAEKLETSSQADTVLGTPVRRVYGTESTAGEVLDETWTDSVLIIHDGRIVLERYENGMQPDTRHLLMSVTKSVVGCVAGVLISQGELGPDDRVERYVPEVARSGYGGATIRNLLDMRTGVKFSEEYQDLDAEVRQIERHMGWRSRPEGERDLGLYGYLATLERESDHGGDFTYRSADTDMLGWVVERASTAQMADLISELIWQPIGVEHDADITCDSRGNPVHDGGMCAATRDLGRFGLMLLHDGEGPHGPVVPGEWLHEARTADPEIREAFRSSDNEPFLPGGWYRNQFWHLPTRSGDVQMCLGINGQMVLVDRNTDTVSVKLSTWPTPQNPSYLIDTIRAFAAVGRRLAGLPESSRGERVATIESVELTGGSGWEDWRRYLPEDDSSGSWKWDWRRYLRDWESSWRG